MENELISGASKTISGPTNVVRLKGNVFGIDKVLYVCFDVHQSCELETSCENIFSDTIVTFLTKEFKKVGDKMIDFFIETFPTKMMYRDISRSIYLQEVRKLVAQAFSYNLEENKVYQSKIFPRVRLHYIDIRDYLFEDILIFQFSNIIDMFTNLFNNILCRRIVLTVNDFIYIKNELNKLKDNVIIVKKIFFEQKGGQQIRIIKQPGEEISSKELQRNTMYLIDKIKNRYAHKEVQEKIIKILNDYLLDSLDCILSGIDTVIKELDDLRNITSIGRYELNPIIHKINRMPQIKIPEYVKILDYGLDSNEYMTKFLDIYTMINGVYEISIYASVFIVDAYFLRRFLDKDYITNGISYTGTLHSLTYIYILTKYFNFEVTHASYSKYGINELNEKIKKSELDFEFKNLFQPPKLYQCSDITGFPSGFS